MLTHVLLLPSVTETQSWLTKRTSTKMLKDKALILVQCCISHRPLLFDWHCKSNECFLHGINTGLKWINYLITIYSAITLTHLGLHLPMFLGINDISRYLNIFHIRWANLHCDSPFISITFDRICLENYFPFLIGSFLKTITCWTWYPLYCYWSFNGGVVSECIGNWAQDVLGNWCPREEFDDIFFSVASFK